MVLGFSHVQLVVRDVAESAPWYCAVLGLEQFAAGQIESGPYVALRHPTARFVVGMQTATPDELVRLAGASVEHLAFTVADRETLLARREELLAQGVDASDEIEEAASWNVRFRDPDGLSIELTAAKHVRRSGE